MAKDFENPINKIIKQAWLDDDFREKLCTSPREVLKEFGVEIEAPEIQVHVNTKEVKHLVLPELPESEMLTDSDLERLVRAGATCAVSRGFFGTCL